MIRKFTDTDFRTTRIAQLRDLIYLLIDDLREMLEQEDHQARRYVDTVFEQTIEYLEELTQLEEKPEYLAPVIEANPNWFPRIEQLRAEHDNLIDAFKRFADRAASEPITYRLIAIDLEKWRDQWLKHDRRESELLVQSQLTDIGVGD